MRKLSTWAKYNPWKARFVIFFGHLLLCSLAIFIGISLNDLDIRLSEALLYSALIVSLIAAVRYPKRYFYRKTADCILALCSFLIVCFLANNFEVKILSGVFPVYGAASINPSTGKPTAEEILASLSHRDKSTLTRTEKRILRKEFKHQVKEYVKAKVTGNKRSADKALLIIVAIIAAIGLIYALGALACTIACNGSEGLAAGIFIAGTIGIVIGLIFVIRAISRGKREKPIERPASNTN